MNSSTKLKQFIPFIFLFILFGILGRELFFAKPNELPSALIGEDIPNFNLPNLFNAQAPLTPEAFKGKVVLLNVWATWCYACEQEHRMLMKIKNTYHVPIYSIDYKDDAKEAMTWLGSKGNPYTIIGNDKNGDVAIDLGVYGTPETFVISQQGKIVYRHIGAIDQAAWDETLAPLIKRYNGE